MSLEFMNPSKGKTLVFGANGFLGSSIANNLSVSEFSVTAVIRPGASQNQLLEGTNLSIIRVSPELWPDLLAEIEPAHVICAQWSGVQKSLRGNFGVQESNLAPIIELAQVAKFLSIETFLALGSQAESSESMSLINEDFSSSGNSPYGEAKSKLCRKLYSLFEESRTRFIWARVFSVYGPSDRSDSLLMELYRSELEGIEFAIRNPNKLWSFLYQDDFAVAVKQILESTNTCGIINVANPQLVEIQYIINTWLGYSQDVSKRYGNNKAGEGFYPVVDKLKSIGWTPKTSLEKGILKTREAYGLRFGSNNLEHDQIDSHKGNSKS